MAKKNSKGLVFEFNLRIFLSYILLFLGGYFLVFGSDFVVKFISLFVVLLAFLLYNYGSLDVLYKLVFGRASFFIISFSFILLVSYIYTVGLQNFFEEMFGWFVAFVIFGFWITNIFFKGFKKK